ncbi:MAG: V-type ATP synthase subunit E [Syntrophorhabdus sp. PtaB.Bin184]|jgi:vacuolar-type H+-ATPase subunit E/Vma4|nr:MAG: V-type ATP synthase subunit E [Syntrophorhabdus sp. PtaB.Bin184]
MSLDKIKEAVLKASRTEAERINAAAARQAKEKLDIQKENLRREFEYQYEARSRLIEEEYARKLAHFQGTAGKEYLEARNASLRAIFDRARETVLAWPADEYGRVMKRFLEKITQGRQGRIRIHPDDREIFSTLLAGIAAGGGEGQAVEIDEGSLPERGGFVFITDDFEVDATIGTILQDIERSLLPEIAEDLARE